MKKDVLIDLSKNENPFGVSPKALASIKNSVDVLNRYPEPHSLTVKKEIGRHLNLSPDNIFVSAGLVEAIDIIIRNFVGEGENMIVSECSFVAYRALAKVFEIEIQLAQMDNYALSTNHFLTVYNAKTRLIFIDNPNNPTGTYIKNTELVKFLKQISKDTYVVLDEAYYEYVDAADYPDSLALLKDYPNLIIMRSFSKIHGLAGLRIGYCISSQETVQKLEYFQAPFTVNQTAASASIAAAGDVDFIKKSFELNQTEKNKLINNLRSVGFKVSPSQTNFIFISFNTKEERDNICNFLQQNRISVCKTDPFGAPKGLRISIGVPKENDYLINCLKE